MTNFELSIEQFKRSVDQFRSYADDEDDPDMRKAWRRDANDLKKVLTRYKNRKFEEAMSMAYSLDTMVRDAIPESAWTIMEQFQR